MKILALVAVGVSALALTACVRPFGASHHRPLKPISKLDCPDAQGQFNRVGVAPDGRSCSYTGPDGAQVQLALISYSGDADTALAPIEARPGEPGPEGPAACSSSAPRWAPGPCRHRRSS